MAKFFISTNQITQAEVNRAAELACDGIHFIGENSPTVKNWTPLLKMNDTLFITEEGATDRDWLLNPLWPAPAPRYDYNIKIARTAGFHVDSSLEYVEHPRTILDPSDYVLASEQLGYPVMLLARYFDDRFEYKARIREALKHPEVRGIVFEINPSAENVRETNVIRGIREVLDANKRCSVILPPWPNTPRYERDVRSAVTELMKSGDYRSSRLSIVLANYDRKLNNVGFYGRRNSIQAALKWLRKNAS